GSTLIARSYSAIAPTISLRPKRSRPCLTYFLADCGFCAEAEKGNAIRTPTAIRSRRFIGFRPDISSRRVGIRGHLPPMFEAAILLYRGRQKRPPRVRGNAKAIFRLSNHPMEMNVSA